MADKIINEDIYRNHSPSIPYSRPDFRERKFTDLVVEQVIERVKTHFLELKRPERGALFENVFPNTLDTTVFYNDVDTFIITGDIPAMW